MTKNISYHQGRMDAIAFVHNAKDRDRARLNQAKCPDGKHWVKPANGKRGFCRSGGDGGEGTDEVFKSSNPSTKKKRNRVNPIAPILATTAAVTLLGGATIALASGSARTEEKIRNMERENFNNHQQKIEETAEELRRERKRQEAEKRQQFEKEKKEASEKAKNQREEYFRKRQEERDKRLEDIQRKAQSAQDEFKRQWEEAQKKAQEKAAEYARQQTEKANSRNTNQRQSTRTENTQQQKETDTDWANGRKGRRGVSDDDYSSLGLDKNASDKEIKKKFRELAIKYHPDYNKGNKEAEEMFKRVSVAYERITSSRGSKRMGRSDSYYIGFFDLIF